jgi:hypothetical protein
MDAFDKFKFTFFFAYLEVKTIIDKNSRSHMTVFNTNLLEPDINELFRVVPEETRGRQTCNRYLPIEVMRLKLEIYFSCTNPET